MARQWRIEFSGALYHIMSRGNALQPIFLDDLDRRKFIVLLSELSERFSIEIYAYVLMGNHYHLLFKTLEPSLSKAMQWIGTTYTRRFNIRHKRSGHLYQGRYKSILIENETYLLQASYYIHRNPLRSGLIGRLADYPWSSYHYYAYKKNAPKWLKTKTILSLIQAKDENKAYRLKVQNYSDEKNKLWEDIKHGLIYGSETFIETIRTNFLSHSPEIELPQHNQIFFDHNSKDIIYQAAQLLNINLDQIKQKRRVCGQEKDNRDLLIYILWQKGRLSNQKMGQFFGLTYSAISKCAGNFQQRLSNSKELRKKFEFINSRFT